MYDEVNFYSRKYEYGWLSNFWRCPQVVDGVTYPTNEHFYQSEKSNDKDIKMWIAAAPNPFLAMKAGRSLRSHEMVDYWDKIKVDVMLKGLRAKFTQNAELKQKLLDTGDAILHEDSKTDLFWGCLGEDMLGKLLMRVRDELRQSQD